MAQSGQQRGAQKAASHAQDRRRCVAVFRKIGAGYQAEINSVLRAFMLARLAKSLGPRDETQIETPDEVTSGTIEIEANMIRDLENFRKMRLGL